MAIEEQRMQAQQEVSYDPSNPYPWYRHMRQTRPVAYNEQSKMWHVFRYRDAHRILADAQTYSSSIAQGNTYLESSFLRMDPPQHGRYRMLMSQAFTPRSVTLLEPRIITIIDELLDAVAHAGKMDVIADLAHPLPVRVIMELFGVPPDARDQFRELSERFIQETDSNPTAAEFVSENQLADFLLPLIEARRTKLTDDLIGRLVAAEVGGEKLSTRDIQASCILILVAGHETTTRLIGNAMYCFTEHPGTMAELRADPELIPGALEEVSRYRPSLCGTFRVARSDALIGETLIKAGQVIMVQLASANQDAEVFADPERFDIRRTPNRHLGFGQGIHFCVGAPLARLESKLAIHLLLQRFPDLQRAPDTLVQLTLGPAGLFQGATQLPMVMTPAASVTA